MAILRSRATDLLHSDSGPVGNQIQPNVPFGFLTVRSYCVSKLWRRRRDSNPRDPFGSNGFQDRRFQPLTHSSAFNSTLRN